MSIEVGPFSIFARVLGFEVYAALYSDGASWDAWRTPGTLHVQLGSLKIMAGRTRGAKAMVPFSV